MLFNEPKLPKCDGVIVVLRHGRCFSALQRAEIAEIIVSLFANKMIASFQCSSTSRNCRNCTIWRLELFKKPSFSALQRAEIAEIVRPLAAVEDVYSFSALQRAEIAEICQDSAQVQQQHCFSALQRAEIAEIYKNPKIPTYAFCFSALQRAEIAEIRTVLCARDAFRQVSVLFNEPKLPKCKRDWRRCVA